MNESKFRYPTEKARKVLERIGARFEGVSTQRDLYLVSDSEEVYRLVLKEGRMFLAHFIKTEGGFVLANPKPVEESARYALEKTFENESVIMRKERTKYVWENAKIATDAIHSLGEFVELETNDKETLEKLMKAFDIEREDLLTKSYYELMNV